MNVKELREYLAPFNEEQQVVVREAKQNIIEVVPEQPQSVAVEEKAPEAEVSKEV